VLLASVSKINKLSSVGKAKMGAVVSNVLVVGRYAMAAHHMAKERYRSLEENALLRA